MHCGLRELERREVARGDRIAGQARGQFGIVHRDMVYDIEVDTTEIGAAAAAAVIVERIRDGTAGAALERMRAGLT